MRNLITRCNHKSKSRLFFILLCPILSPVLLAATPDFPPPPQAVVEWVGKNLEVNGIKSAVRSFHTRESIEKVVEFYRREWKRPVAKDMPGFMETIDAAPWYIISRVEDGYLLTVQVQVKENDKSGSWGYLSMSPLPGKNNSISELGKGTPKMSNSHVLSEMKSNDPGKKASTMIISNGHSVSSNVTFYRNHYQSKGWTVETDRDLGQGKVHTLVFKTRLNRITMMFVKDKEATRIVINSVTNSLL
jgi:hypothetical protein